MVVTVADPGDPTADPTKAWPPGLRAHSSCSGSKANRMARRHSASDAPPQSDAMHALPWDAHFYLAFAFFAVIPLHVAAALFHALVRRDGVFESMAPTPSHAAPTEVRATTPSEVRVPFHRIRRSDDEF
jgi:hypothetical protein